MNSNLNSIDSNKAMHRVLIEGVEEIIGPEDAHDVVSQAMLIEPALPFLREVQRALAARYGLPSGLGVALRTGRAAFKYSLRAWGEEIGVNNPSFRLLPSSRRIRAGLEKMAAFFSELWQARISVSEDDAHWIWQVESCPDCAMTGDTACYLLTGLLQEYMAWAAGGKYFRVQEIICAVGSSSACQFRIDKQGLE
jgi:predicted hydrocarbon binding protein